MVPTLSASQSPREGETGTCSEAHTLVAVSGWEKGVSLGSEDGFYGCSDRLFSALTL